MKTKSNERVIISLPNVTQTEIYRNDAEEAAAESRGTKDPGRLALLAIRTEVDMKRAGEESNVADRNARYAEHMYEVMANSGMPAIDEIVATDLADAEKARAVAKQAEANADKAGACNREIMKKLLGVVGSSNAQGNAIMRACNSPEGQALGVSCVRVKDR